MSYPVHKDVLPSAIRCFGSVISSLVQARNTDLMIAANAELEQKRRQTQIELEKLRVERQEKFQWQQFERQKELQEQLATYNRQTQLLMANKQRETALQTAEAHKIWENWPLSVTASQILGSHSSNGSKRLMVIISPPEVNFDRYVAQSSPLRIETDLTQGLRKFLNQHYSLHRSVRPVKFLGGAWASNRFHSEASITALFSMLSSQPTLAIESQVNGDYLNFNAAYWGLGQQEPVYENILDDLNHRELIFELAKRRGADKPSQEDIKVFSQLLVALHSLVAGWIADAHHLIHNDVPPLLPQLLPGLIETLVPTEEFRTVFDEVSDTIVPGYQKLYEALRTERPAWSPELMLEFAESLTPLPDKSWVRKQIHTSVKLWLEQRQVPQPEEEELFEVMHSVLQKEDLPYIEQLDRCFTALEDERGIESVKGLLSGVEELSRVVWTVDTPVSVVEPGSNLRIKAQTPFGLHWTDDNWQTKKDALSKGAADSAYVDIAIPETDCESIQFTFFWRESNTWEGRNFEVSIGEFSETFPPDDSNARDKFDRSQSQNTETSTTQSSQKITNSFLLYDSILTDYHWYENLRDDLSKRNWGGANRVTEILLSELALEVDYIGEVEDPQHILNCLEKYKRQLRNDIKNINGLWMEYSNGLFGFQAQKEVYDSVSFTSSSYMLDRELSIDERKKIMVSQKFGWCAYLGFYDEDMEDDDILDDELTLDDVSDYDPVKIIKAKRKSDSLYEPGKLAVGWLSSSYRVIREIASPPDVPKGFLPIMDQGELGTDNGYAFPYEIFYKLRRLL